MIPGIVSGAVLAVGGGASFDYAFSENLADTDITGSGEWAAVNTLNVTPEVEDYVVFFSASLTGSSEYINHGIRLTVDGTPVFTGYGTQRSVTPNCVFPLGGMYFHAGSGSPTAFAVEGGHPAVAGTTTIDDSRITLLKLGPDDATAVALSEQTNLTNTLSTALTLAIDPPSVGDYYVIVSGLIRTNNAGVEAFLELSDGVTTISAFPVHPNLTNSIAVVWPFVLMLPVLGLSSARNVTLKYRSSMTHASAGVIISEVRGLALRADRFANAYFVREAADDSLIGDSYTTATTQTFTPAAADHLLLANVLLGSSNASSSAYGLVDDGGTTIYEGIMDPPTSTTTIRAPYFASRVASYAASSRTQTIQRKHEFGVPASTVIGRGSALLTLDLSGLTSA